MKQVYIFNNIILMIIISILKKFNRLSKQSSKNYPKFKQKQKRNYRALKKNMTIQHLLYLHNFQF